MLKLQNMVTNPVSTVFVFYTAWHIHTWVWRRGRGRTWGDSVLVPRAASSPWCSPKCHHWMQETISNSYIMYMLLSILYPQILQQQNLCMEFCIMHNDLLSSVFRKNHIFLAKNSHAVWSYCVLSSKKFTGTFLKIRTDGI